MLYNCHIHAIKDLLLKNMQRKMAKKIDEFCFLVSIKYDEKEKASAKLVRFEALTPGHIFLLQNS